MNKLQILIVVFVRAVFFTLIIIGLNQVEVIGTNPFMLSGFILIGALISSLLAFSKLSQKGFWLLSAFVVILFYLCAWASSFIPAAIASHILMPYNYILHGEILLILFLVSSISTWCFWRLRDTPTVELLLIISGCVLLLSGHREFRLDNPKELSTLAWTLGIDQIYMFTALGVLVAIAALLYLAIASLPARQALVQKHSPLLTTHGKRSFLSVALTSAFLIAIFAFTFQFIYSYYEKVSQTRLANGVGESSQEGLSPLGFHSALGSTNQPAALVRLEGDYRENPFTPMLYLRENALSEYDGHEMVIANDAYDKDVAGTSPSTPYEGEQDQDLEQRISITQSVYLLADHNLSMAIDYPIAIRPLKNPNPAKFKGSFRAYSMVPAFPKESLFDAQVGDPRWDEKTRNHYLKTSPDPRYTELSTKITSVASNPVGKALALTQYLSKKSIYTLTPKHEVADNTDQTAPYLFGDMRGYCVHFAHAMVYMLRGIGIPARIGTGYLTDLSQSKDGHILLRMSDRHAWAEVYITHKGWVPFDIQPEQVENHADTQVDLKLLEDLMGMLEPGEEILPKDLTADEPSFDKDWSWSLPVPSLRTLAFIAIGILFILALIKLTLRYGWMIALNPKSRLIKSYISIASRLVDLGLARQNAETRTEYRNRLAQTLGFDVLPIAEKLTALTYSPNKTTYASTHEIDSLRNAGVKFLKTLPLAKKILCILNFSSLKSLFQRGSW
jgi:protein-glutamine gamma-glutamyltransferase